MILPRKSRTAHSGVEVLETRIAPATLIQVGGPDEAGDRKYTSSTFVDTGTTFGTDSISAVVGKGEVLAPSADVLTYYVKLGPGDAMVIYDPASQKYRPFISAPVTTAVDVKDTPRLACTVVAFFVDIDADGLVDENELTGMALGNNAKVQVHGVVYGDVVANYNDRKGALGGDGELLGRAKELPENTVSLFSASAVRGSIVSGGPINGIRVTGAVGQILSGSAANTYRYDFFFGGSRPGALVDDGGDTLAVTPGVRKAGTTIQGVSVGSLGTIARAGDVGANATDFGKADYVGLIRAGNGGDGGVGGSITGITVLSDADGFTIQAGAGGMMEPERRGVVAGARFPMWWFTALTRVRSMAASTAAFF